MSSVSRCSIVTTNFSQLMNISVVLSNGGNYGIGLCLPWNRWVFLSTGMLVSSIRISALCRIWALVLGVQVLSSAMHTGLVVASQNGVRLED